ncbi:MAG TPA: hypothetical protein VKP30_23340, partial [Polyangiaceae bacterium]|nr:hypothetical protein [Polyangiaceae bacterium]
MSLNRSSYVLYGALTSLSLVATACGDSGSQTNAGPSGVAPETDGVDNGNSNGDSNNNHDGSSGPPVTS